MDDVTRVLAFVLGAYFLITGLGVVARRKVIAEFVKRFREDPVLSFMAGVLALWLGLGILAVHWNFGDAVAAGVSVIGLAAAIKGALLILIGPRLLVLARPFDDSLGLAAVWGLLIAVIGGALMVAGALG